MDNKSLHKNIMDTEAELRNAMWIVLEDQIHGAFKEVKLGNGIGLYEASAIDDYLKPEEESYQEERARDEREDWTKLLPLFEESDGYISNYCFMDIKGLHFFLPVMLLCFWESTCFMFSRIDKVDSDTFQLWQRLTSKQQKIVVAFFEYVVDIDGTVDYLMNRVEEKCETCGKIICEGPYSFDQAMNELETNDYYQTLLKLKSIEKI